MADDFASHSEGLSSPADNALVITPSADPLAKATRGIYVGGAGDLNVTMVGGGNVLFSAVPAGTILPIRCTHILESSTDATLIVALW